jgi:hypothetical protein
MRAKQRISKRSGRKRKKPRSGRGRFARIAVRIFSLDGMTASNGGFVVTNAAWNGGGYTAKRTLRMCRKTRCASIWRLWRKRKAEKAFA